MQLCDQLCGQTSFAHVKAVLGEGQRRLRCSRPSDLAELPASSQAVVEAGYPGLSGKKPYLLHSHRVPEVELVAVQLPARPCSANYLAAVSSVDKAPAAFPSHVSART